ncbi:MAG: GNAT family N-acetyltransferase [Schlesneria sp.]
MNGAATEKAVRIRRYQPDDANAVYDAVMESKEELSHWMSWCHDTYSRNDAVAWVESRLSAWETNQDWSFVVVNDEGKLLGACGIHRIDRLNGVGELGYWVRTSATRNGVATSATRQLCQWAFEENGLHRIEIVVSEENAASLRVAAKVGAVREGILRERILLHGRRHNGELWAILKDT